eukprot:jgi/Bigna1/67171/fgenesh1_pg.3_\
MGECLYYWVQQSIACIQTTDAPKKVAGPAKAGDENPENVKSPSQLKRLVIIGDHYPAINENVKKQHWKALSAAIEGWSEECKGGNPLTILAEQSVPSNQTKIPLQIPQSDKSESQSKRDLKIEARQKAELAILTQHLRSKLCYHSQQIRDGTLNAELKLGQKVEIMGLQSAPHFNGLAGKIASESSDNGRYSISIEGHQKPFLLKRANLKLDAKDVKTNLSPKSNLIVDMVNTYDLAYLGTFVVLAIKFWKPVQQSASAKTDGDRMLRFIKNSHDVAWVQLFAQVKSILAESRKVEEKSQSEELKAMLQQRTKELALRLKQAREFCAKYAEDENERYCLSFFSAVKTEGDSALQKWCSWADKLAYAARDLMIFNRILAKLKVNLECIHFGGTMVKLLPNHPPSAISKFDDNYLEKVVPSAFTMQAKKGGLVTQTISEEDLKCEQSKTGKKGKNKKKKGGKKKARPRR